MTIGIFFSQCSYITIQYLWHHLQNRWGLWDYCLFAFSVLLFVISKGLLLRYSAFDSRFCCSFNISKPLAQGWPSLKQWTKWSLLTSAFKFNSQLLNDLMTRFFSSQFQDSKIHWTTNCREEGFVFLLQCTDVRLKLTIHDKIPLCRLWKVCSRPRRVLEHTWCIPQESKHHRFSSVLTIS